MTFYETRESTENIAETAIVGATELSHFEASGWTNNESLGDYLRDTLPPTHLENCETIRYNETPSDVYPNALGLFNTESREINIYGPPERFLMEDGGLQGILTHEIGHNVHQNLIECRPDLAERWEVLHTQNLHSGEGFVSAYATTNVYEDFAESYKYFVVDGERLSFLNPDKYAFMKEVFSGKEHEMPTDLAYWDHDSAGNKIEVTSSGVYDLRGSRIG